MIPISYLFEVSRLKKEIRLGKLSDEGIMKARMAGQIKPFHKWRKGIDKGTNELIRKSGAKKLVSSDSFGVHKDRIYSNVPQMMTRDGERLVVLPKTSSSFYKDKNLSPRDATIINRHEADESRYGKEYKNKFGVNLAGRFSKREGTGEKHVSARVTKRESENLNTGKAYGLGSFLRSHREKTGESNLVKKSDKELKKIESRRIKDFLKKSNQISPELNLY
jgi:hypothetical protein